MMTLFDLLHECMQTRNAMRERKSHLQEIAEDAEFEEITTNLIEYEQDKEIIG